MHHDPGEPRSSGDRPAARAEGTPPSSETGSSKSSLQERARRLSGTPLQLRDAGSYDPRPVRESTRSWLAKALAWLLSATTISIVGLAAADLLSVNEATDLAQVVLSPLVAITGTALGFYFGGQQD